MTITEANISISRNDGKLTISVLMPIWNKLSEQGNLVVRLPLLGIETIAKDEKDAEKAIEEAIISFCVVAEKFGQGIEKELQALGWISEINGSNDSVLEYNVEDTDSLLERLFNTGEQYVNPKLEIA